MGEGGTVSAARAGRRGRARQQLLEAAARRFYADGVAATGIDTITAEAGVAKMSLYNNFSSKATSSGPTWRPDMRSGWRFTGGGWRRPATRARRSWPSSTPTPIMRGWPTSTASAGAGC